MTESRTKKIPEWFSLENYNQSFKDLSTAQWFEQLSARREIEDWLSYPRKSEELSFFQHLIESNPIINTSAAENSMLRDLRLSEMLLEAGNPKSSAGVRRMNVMETLDIARSLGSEKYEYANKYLDELKHNSTLTDPEPTKYSRQDWFRDAIDSYERAYPSGLTLIVNTKLPDNILIEQFKEQLKLQRTKIPEPRVQKFNPVKIMKYGVMPYLDLTTWAKINGITLTKGALANAIFPPHEADTDAVKTTTKSYAKHILSDESLAALASLIAHEKSEKN